MFVYTDYPLSDCGPLCNGKTHKVEAIKFDGNKYCTVKHNGNTEEIKIGYLFTDLSLKDTVKSCQVPSR